jgi:Sec-independent protein translocase protein TatA
VYEMALAAETYSDWYLGLVIGFVVVVVVVALVAVLLTSAARIGEQARRATDGLDEVRSSTAVLWEVRKTNAAAPAILEATRAAREAVVAKLTGAPDAPTAPGLDAPGPAPGLDAPPPGSAPSAVSPATWRESNRLGS